MALAEEDRLMLLRLSEQVSTIAEKLERLHRRSAEASTAREGLTDLDKRHLKTATEPLAGNAADENERVQLSKDNDVTKLLKLVDNSAFRWESGSDEGFGDHLIRPRHKTPPLPDPRLIRRIIRERQIRARFFEGDLFADPAWDILLDLTAARGEHCRVSVTSLCISAGVPPTTALRWISQMTDAGLLQRVDDVTDRRRAFITLTDKALDAICRYFEECRPQT